MVFQGLIRVGVDRVASHPVLCLQLQGGGFHCIIEVPVHDCSSSHDLNRLNLCYQMQALIQKIFMEGG